jgi:hypothetical protein
MLYDISYVYNIQSGVYAETFRPSSAGRSLYSLFIFIIFLSRLLVHESLMYFFCVGNLEYHCCCSDGSDLQSDYFS